LSPAEPVSTNPERPGLAGLLADYSGLTREACALDLRQFATWCSLRSLHLFTVRRADIECFSRDLETKGRARTTITRWLSTSPVYRHAVEEGLLDHSLAAHARKPRTGNQSHATGPGRNELDALLSLPGSGCPTRTRSSPCSPPTGYESPRPPA
jgi:site-specific recombinase XerD